ncbi:retrovirus-related pol polyprotein from transposon TNT 1-94 [Tanacetum coccineum]
MTEPSWIDAMQEENHEFERLQVWELVSCPDKVLQEEGIDFEESFAPVARIAYELLKDSARRGRERFRERHLQRVRYKRPSRSGVSQPGGFVDQDNPSHVYKLKKALYGLKQYHRHVCLCARYQAKPTEKHFTAVETDLSIP